MLKKVRENIIKHRMLEKGDRVIVAVSGGADSVALLKVFELLAPEYGMTLVAAHLNHGLRGEEARMDEEFVKQLSGEMGIECACRTTDVASLSVESGRSIEDIGREIRYDFLDEVARKFRANKIALGHNLHDQVETVIMNLLRGSGPGGLKGILPVRDSLYIRPLYNITRDEIITFLEAHGMTFMSDCSNMETHYLRNRIRNELIPELKKHYNPNVEHTLFATSEIMRLEHDYMTGMTDRVLSQWEIGCSEKEVKIRISDLRSCHEALQNRVLQRLLNQFATPGKGVSFTHIKSVLRLAFGDDPNGCVKLPFDIDVRREYGTLILSKRENRDSIEPSEIFTQGYYEVKVPGVIEIGELGRSMHFEFAELPVPEDAGSRNTVYIDYEKVVFPLIVRSKRPGDWIQPSGMQGSKKIKSYFIDMKIPRHKRTQIPLLVDSESVLWIAGMRVSERVKITDKTRKVLKIEFV